MKILAYTKSQPFRYRCSCLHWDWDEDAIKVTWWLFGILPVWRKTYLLNYRDRPAGE